MRQRGFEPPRYCYRQPLKLVRLPVPPLPPADILSRLVATRHAFVASYSGRFAADVGNWLSANR